MAARDRAIRAQVMGVVGVGSAYWRERFTALGLDPTTIAGAAELSRIPPVTERDVSPGGEPADFAALVVAPPERWAVHADGLALRRALARRLIDRDAYRRAVAYDTRPVSFLSAGLTVDYLLACTRGDLDLMARAGARLLAVLGVGAADTMLLAVPPGPSVGYRGLALAALAAGVPALTPGADPGEVAAYLAIAPASVLAAPADQLADLLDALSGTDLSGLRLAVAVGVPSAADRLAAEQALADAGAAPGARVLAVHAPSGARVLWAECPGQAALHTYPDLEVVEVCDPDTGEDYAGSGVGELVITQLGFRGSALLRWRTGDLVAGPVVGGPCPGCGRNVPRLPTDGMRAGGLAVTLGERSGGARVDLRMVTGVLAGWAGLDDWALGLGRRGWDGTDLLTAYLATTGDPGELAVGLAPALAGAAAPLRTQVVISAPEQYAPPAGARLTARIWHAAR